MKKKNEKKKEGKRCRNGLGYYPTVSQYIRKLYCDTAGLKGVQGLAVGGEGHDTVGCIVTGVQVWLGGVVSQYKELYCDKQTVG